MRSADAICIGDGRWTARMGERIGHRRARLRHGQLQRGREMDRCLPGCRDELDDGEEKEGKPRGLCLLVRRRQLSEMR